MPIPHLQEKRLSWKKHYKMKYTNLFFFLISLPCIAQTGWIEERAPFPVAGQENGHALTYLYYEVEYDYKYNESGQFICDVAYHVIARPTNDDGLESINTIYIPIGNVIEILDIQSRVITEDGLSIELDKSDIKEIKDEEQGGYRIFAVEGAEVGREIEYRYVKRVYGSTFINEKAQFTFPINKLKFTLTCPENLEFEFFIANDSGEVKQVDTLDTHNSYQVELLNIPAYSVEAFSGLDANKKRIDFRLAYNSVVGKKRINTYSDAGKRLYDQAHNLSKAEIKAIENFIKKNDDTALDQVSRLKAMEHVLKSRYYQEEHVPNDVDYLFENGFAGKKAFLKLFVAIAEHLDMDYEIVAVANRFESKFEASFDSWNYLNDYLLYFPGHNAFLPVHAYSERYGTVPDANSAAYGLFIHPEVITDFTYPITRTDYIPAVGYERNMNNLYIDVHFDQGITKSIVEAKQVFTGTEAALYKAALFWIDQEQQTEMLKEVARYLSPGGELLDVELVAANNTFEDWEEPFEVKCQYESENIIEFAGSSILFKVGELIGMQSELYQEQERVYEIENTHNRGYLRELLVEIPEGYKIQNLEDILIDEKVLSENTPVFIFKSDYELNGNQLKITINEYYDQIFYPKEKFEDFRRVINAAADWNKVTLVLKEI